VHDLQISQRFKLDNWNWKTKVCLVVTDNASNVVGAVKDHLILSVLAIPLI